MSLPSRSTSVSSSIDEMVQEVIFASQQTAFENNEDGANDNSCDLWKNVEKVQDVERSPSHASVECQTDHSWLLYVRKLQLKNKSQKLSRLKHNDVAVQASPKVNSASTDDQLKSHSKTIQFDSADQEENLIPNKDEARRSKSGAALKRVKADASANAIGKDLDNSGFSSLSEDGEMAENQVELKTASLVSIPWPSREDEYGIPVTLSSDDETWRLDESSESEADADEQHSDAELADMTTETDEPSKGHLWQRFGGTCQFCGKEIKQLPSLEEQASLPPEQLYCCSDYREYLGIYLSRGLAAADKMARKVLRARGQSTGNGEGDALHSNTKADAATDLSSVADSDEGSVDNMATINYQLSSRHCMKVGWTIRAASPVFIDSLPEHVDEPPQLQPSLSSCRTNVSSDVLTKSYDNGQPFLLIFPNGSGNVYYPSGRIAITILSFGVGLYTLLVHDDCDVEQQILGLFDPYGWGTTFYSNGQIRVSLSPLGGIELDGMGVKRHKWTWYNKCVHVHAPPLYPVNVALSRTVNLHVGSQSDMVLTFSCASRACRFSVAPRCKVRMLTDDILADDVFDENEAYRKQIVENFEGILEKVSSILRLPNAVKLPTVSSPRQRQTVSDPSLSKKIFCNLRTGTKKSIR